ncbi:excalibur calcium-binding domain-containing protein [Methyloversatilis discipulorum]|uniref:excalibur calcium-binding domain-containing protein n=1 Tax=Methyloversatilis discipulorum TaxID=1119528 RepID=UPI0018DED6C3|nr:excalibur calcium-binding domain-containing protein [Methyloversatilis discipulorum]
MRFSPCPLRMLPGALTLLACAGAAAHPGGLNAEGCHNNRRTGDYHCHRGAPARTSSSATEGAAAVPTGRAFRNCAEARAAGAAPVRAGEPGYGPHLDRDGDGIGCEPYRGR